MYRYIIFLFITCSVHAQVPKKDSSFNDTLFSIVEAPNYPSDIGFIKISGVLHQYAKNFSTINNIRLIELSPDKVQTDSLGDDNIVVSSTICRPHIKVFQISQAGDSIPYRAKQDSNKRQKDSIIPAETYVYSQELLPHGWYKRFFKNGTIRTKGKYYNGFKHGTWLFYDEKANVVRKEKWRYGQMKR